MGVAFKDLQPGCIVLIAGFDDIQEHQLQWMRSTRTLSQELSSQDRLPGNTASHR